MRAIFIVQPLGNVSTAMILAILTLPGHWEMAGRAVWVVDAAWEVAGPPLVESATPLDEPELRQRVTDLAALIVLYRLTSPDTGTVVPVRREDAPVSQSAKRRRRHERMTSLFHIVDLDSPPDRFGRPAEGSLDGAGGDEPAWRLDHRVRVRGHFRLQSHGPRHQLRKLIWVEAHGRGPAGAARRTELIVLRERRSEPPSP